MNYYQILDIKQDANEEEIKLAYKTLVKKYHPDIYKGDKSFAEKKIQEINVAYEVLSNPESRTEYDNEINPQINNINYSYTVSPNTENSSDFYNNMQDRVINSFDKMPFEKKFKSLLLVFIAYILFLIFSFYQIFSIFNQQNNSNNKTNNIINENYSNVANQNYDNDVQDDDYNNDVQDVDYNNQETLNQINVEDYISEDELYELYTDFFYLHFPTFEEFKSNVYNLNDEQSTNSIE